MGAGCRMLPAPWGPGVSRPTPTCWLLLGWFPDVSELQVPPAAVSWPRQPSPGELEPSLPAPAMGLSEQICQHSLASGGLEPPLDLISLMDHV